ncbi:MAG: hypothetical protein CMK46_01620 [Porticoccus sp.]|uniref:hypothetical protein n=1 Tax=Porticoccus hydrocarbonoclasticus TaxID=1073414 RepID=UPI000C4C561A|nr:hypothetical protein [Porticoccus hydrocarbonoclasticus]MBG56968.1 hypothetical protein [Porticoccus sp.]|tara:strand:+ start:3352 stop:3798 length:447 start_codon:yes stop_codon:yes gene_type:complete
MRSEFQYFMSQDDHAAFDSHLLSIDGVTIKQGKHFDEIRLGDGFIQYERSILNEGILTSGRIAIASTDLERSYNFSSYQAVEALYKKLRSWLKKRSINTLVCYNEKSENYTVQAVKNFWLVTGAETLLNESGIKLKQFESGNVVFKLA